jgi:hypothetical protein
MSFPDRFRREWLFEAPVYTGPSTHDTFPDMLLALRTNLAAGNKSVDLGNGLKKLDLGNQVTYWLEKNQKINIITQFEKTPNGLYVELTGKRHGADIYASDFYVMISQLTRRLIFSGELLSSEGHGIWKHLLDSGKGLFVYNIQNPAEYQTIDSEQDLLNYLGTAEEMKKYRFVLSESQQHHSYVVTSFDLLKTHNLTFGVGFN